MKRDLGRLEAEEFDLLVIGGGIFGACAFWDATQRGLRAALIERGDFCSATSANSFRVVHGGIRYLQHLDIARLRRSSKERRALLRIAPHLVSPLPIIIPTYGHGMRGKQALRVGTAVYDLLTPDKSRGIGDPSRRIPNGSSLSKEAVLRLFPGLDDHGLSGGVQFWDGQIYNPPRLVLAFVQQAVARGGAAANYVEATGFLRQANRVVGVGARDHLSGEDFEIRARVTLNATGPYAERFLQRTAQVELSPRGYYSRDACFIVPRRLFPAHQGLAVLGGTSDPDAIFSRGRRHLFLVPWRECTLIGVWHVVYEDDPDRLGVSDAEIQAFLDEVNESFPALDLSLDDVSLWNAGLVPFGQNEPGQQDLRYGHESQIVDHSRTHGIEDLVTLIGIRYTMARLDAKRALDLAVRKLGAESPDCRTDSEVLDCGKIGDFEHYLQQAEASDRLALSPEVMYSLVRSYGSGYDEVIEYAKSSPELAETLADSNTIKAQVIHAVRAEMAHSLSDLVFRRTDLATGEYPGEEALRAAAETMGMELNWSETETREQISEVRKRFSAREIRRKANAVE